jgi:hypothetical protein
LAAQSKRIVQLEHALEVRGGTKPSDAAPVRK